MKSKITVVNVGTKIQPTHSTSNSSKLRTRSHSNETYIKNYKKDEVCHSFVVEIFTKSLHRGGVNMLPDGITSYLTNIEVIHRIFFFSINQSLPTICTFLLVLTIHMTSWACKKASVVDLSMKVASIAQKVLH